MHEFFRGEIYLYRSIFVYLKIYILALYQIKYKTVIYGTMNFVFKLIIKKFFMKYLNNTGIFVMQKWQMQNAGCRNACHRNHPYIIIIIRTRTVSHRGMIQLSLKDARYCHCSTTQYLLPTPFRIFMFVQLRPGSTQCAFQPKISKTHFMASSIV